VSGDGTQPFADAFARQGCLTLAPDSRIYGGSDKGPDPYRTGFAVDLINLIVSVKSLPQARADDIGLWGYRRGGGAGHSFYNGAWSLCLARTLDVFNAILTAP
jgi:hypothetical protein